MDLVVIMISTLAVAMATSTTPGKRRCLYSLLTYYFPIETLFNQNLFLD